MASHDAAAAGVPEMAPVFQPTVWGDFFINYDPEPLQACVMLLQSLRVFFFQFYVPNPKYFTDHLEMCLILFSSNNAEHIVWYVMQMSEERMAKRSNELKEKITGLFARGTMVEQLNLADTLQHLSIDHHFHEQIVSTLRSTHAGGFDSSSLHDVALRFRLLRQQGFWVSPGISIYIHMARKPNFVWNIHELLAYKKYKNIYRHEEDRITNASQYCSHDESCISCRCIHQVQR